MLKVLKVLKVGSDGALYNMEWMDMCLLYFRTQRLDCTSVATAETDKTAGHRDDIGHGQVVGNWMP